MWTNIRVALSVAFALVTVPPTSAQNAPLFQFTEKPGPHAVGLKVIEQYDYSRIYRSATDDLGKPYHGERARPLQILIWYPANESSAKPMTVGDYGRLISTETSFGKPKTETDVQEWNKGMTPALAMPLWAVWNAPLESGHFPSSSTPQVSLP